MLMASFSFMADNLKVQGTSQVGKSITENDNFV